MGQFLSQFFLNPAMLLGTTLVALPIIIYLLNRRRFQRRRWAAMEFLLRALKRNRRRLQVQNLLLLIVRCLIVLLIVLLAARPVSRLSVLNLSPDKSQNWILVLDTSYSMGYVESSRTLFEQARETVFSMIDDLLRSGDQVAVLAIDQHPRTILAPTRLDEEGRKSLRREMEALRLSNNSVDLGASFAVLDELCGKFVSSLGEPEPKRIVFFSDLQRKDWIGEEGPKSPGLPQFMEKIQKEGGTFAFAQLGVHDRRSNLAVTDLSVSPALLAKDLWVELRATIRNFGDEELSNVDLSVRVDQAPGDAAAEPQVGQVIRVPPGEAITRSLPIRFDTAGYHTAVAEIRSDDLAVDNLRYLAIRVEDSVKVLLVDGNPSGDPTERATFNLQVALEPDDDSLAKVQGRFTPFETQYVTPDQVAGVDLKEHAVVILAGVAELDANALASLESYVRRGGALVVFLGPNVRPEFYNQRMHGEGEGPHLLPTTLREVHGDKRYPVNLQISDLSHPLVQYFSERKEVTHIERPVISFYEYYQVAPIAPDLRGVRVAFRFNDAQKSPAVFDNAYGAGRVLWITSSADGQWNEFANWPDFVVFLYESISYLVKFGMSSSNLGVGDPFRKTYPATQYAADILLTAPARPSETLEGPRSVRKAMKSLASPGSTGVAAADTEFELTHDDTDVPGLYRWDFQRTQETSGNSVEQFAVNLDTSESDLRPLTDEDLKSAFELLRYERFDASARIRDLKEKSDIARGKEYWRWLAGGVLLLLLAETVLAWLFGRSVK